MIRSKLVIQLEKGKCDALQLAATWRRASLFFFNYEAHNAFNTSTNAPRFGDPGFLSDMEILMISGHLLVFWPYLHCACAETSRKNSDIAIRFSYPDF